MATNAEWSRGYARQADADLNAFLTFEGIASLAVCHKLQFLQMACEKLVKSHLCFEGTDSAALQTSHAYVAGTLPVVLLQTARRISYSGRSAKSVLRQAKLISREIELLAPAVKRGGSRPDNCEYPWEDGNGTLHVPLDWSFPHVELLNAPAGHTFLKLIRVAIDSLLA